LLPPGGFVKVWFHGLERIMSISKELLAILVCPVCKQPVHLLPDESGIKCDACKRIYPIRDGIPVMLPDEATVAPD
jgi:hypothetical protein